MDDMTIKTLGVFLFAIFPCAVAGYLIAFKNRRSLIAGYQEKNITDPQAFGKRIGITLMIFSTSLTLALCCWLLGFITEQQMANSGLFFIICVLVSYCYNVITFRDKTL